MGFCLLLKILEKIAAETLVANTVRNFLIMKEILTEKYISPELRQKIIDDLRLKEDQYNNNII